MKRYNIVIISMIFGFQVLFAQNETDVLRFSQNFISGTARSVGIGGAVNPAGLGIYRGSEITFTPYFSWNITSSSFLGNNDESTRRNLGISNFGYVSFKDLNRESGWISLSFAFGYNLLSNYQQQSFMAGINNQNSLLDDFVDLSDDPNSGEFLFYKDLAFKDSLLVFNNNTQKYTTDFNIDGYGQYQERLITTSGSTGEYSFSIGGNYDNTLYLGASLGVKRVRFDRTIVHTEDDQEGNINYVDRFIFNEDLRTHGYGFDFKLGAIYRPLEFLRIGAAFHVPAIYFLKDQFTTDLSAYYDYYNPRTASSPIGDFSYRIISPYKIVGSAAATIGQIALISLDYEYVDYSSAKIESETNRFSDENNAIKVLYKPSSNIKAGGEIRFSPIYFRAGYAFYGSPYALVDPNANEHHSVFSGGIGVRSRSTFVDLGISRNSFDQAYYMYKSQVANGAVISSDANKLLLTVGFRF